MARASLVPSLDSDIHLVLCRFGRAGLAYIETDPAEADATRVVQNLLFGRYDKPLRVVALNLEEGWSRDVSETMAFKVREMARQDDIELTDGTLAFIDAHTEATLQPTLPPGEPTRAGDASAASTDLPLHEDLKGRTFILSGFTDAKGSETYNQGLSERRADAVKQFLSEKYGIETSNLVTGMPVVAGSDQPISAPDIRTSVARILVGLPFALARLMEATSHFRCRLASARHYHDPCRRTSTRARRLFEVGTRGVVFEVKRRDTSQPPGVALGRPPNKNFCCYQTFLIKRGWVLRSGTVNPD